MKPGNKSLFWNKISSVSFHLFPDMNVLLWKSALPSKVLWKAWVIVHGSLNGTYNWCSEWYITCTVKTKNDDKMEQLEQVQQRSSFWGRTWHSKWHEDLLSCVRMNDGLRADSMKASTCCQEPKHLNVWKQIYDWWITYLFDLLSFPQLNMWAVNNTKRNY